MKIFKYLLITMTIAWLIPACATLPATEAPPISESPSAIPDTSTPSPTTPPVEPTIPSNPIVAAAIKDLASQLGIAESTITVESIEEVEWRNGCLEIETPGIACTDVIVPGFRILLQANGQTYEYRSNLDGSLLLLIQTITPTLADKIAQLARAALAAQLNISEEAITITSIEAVNWPDGCLGIYHTDQACITVITPGFRIVLQANGQTYEYHSNQDGSQMLLALSVPAIAEVPALQVDIQGGIVGFCDQVNLFLSGLATYQSCNAAQEIRLQLTLAQLQTLQTLVKEYRAFEYTQADPAVADQMVVQFVFNGVGTLEPTQETYAQMQALAMEVINQARGTAPDS